MSKTITESSFLSIIEGDDESILEVKTKAPGPVGSLPLSDAMLRNWPSGDLFGLSQNAGMGWSPALVDRDGYLILSTQGGLRGEDGQPIALGYHTGHWEVGLLVREAAKEFKELGFTPFAGMVSDPCDGRTQGTTGMMDSLPYRNDAAIVFRRLIRSLPTRKGVLGVATCDKGLPAMLIALAGTPDLPSVLVPGGVTLPPEEGEDAGKIQSLVHAILAWRNHIARGSRAGLSGVRKSRRRVPILGHRGHSPSRFGGAGHELASLGSRAFGSTHLERCSAKVR